MGKWFAQILGTILAGILVWWVTQGILSEKLNGKEEKTHESSYELERERIAREQAEARARKAEEAARNLEIGYVCKLNPNGDNFLSLREGPGTIYPEILRMGGNTVVIVLEMKELWYRVRINNGTTGWVHRHWICQGSP